jgi:hypothetical protein
VALGDDEDLERWRQRTVNYFGQPVDVELLAPRQGLPATGAPPPTPPEYTEEFETVATTPPRGADPTRSNLPSLAQEQGLGIMEIGELAQKVLGTASDVAKVARDFMAPSHEMPPETRAAFEAQRAGERAGTAAGEAIPVGIAAPGTFTTGPTFGGVPLDFGEYSSLFAPGSDVTIPFLPGAAEAAGGELAGAGGELAGAGAGAETAGASFGQVAGIAGSALAAAGSIYGAIQADEDYQKALHAAAAGLAIAGPFTGGVTAVVAAVLELGLFLEGLFGGPSEEWLSFGPRLQENLETTRVAMEQLTVDIDAAQSPEELGAVIGKYRDTIGTYAGGFGTGAAPLELPVPPGATGTEHESGLIANWEEATRALEAMRDLKLASFREAEPPAPAAAAAPPPAAATPSFVPWRQAGVPLSYGEALP